MKALISVSDKTGVVELARDLVSFGFEIISTGGTATALKQANVPTTEISEFTGFPEILEGRVKTLHPKVFAGILSIRSSAKHQGDMNKNNLEPIDWVVVNLYPFERISMENKIPKSEMIEFIDIGGVSLLRAAGKNFADVVTLCDPRDYAKVVAEYKQDKKISINTKRNLAAKTFGHTAHYDSMIAKFFQREDNLITDSKPPLNPADKAGEFPEEFTIGLRKLSDLRYGENPQQKASVYKESGDREWGVVNAEKLQGKELSFNNYLDLDAAWQIVNSQSSPELSRSYAVASGTFCVIIKHTNPCGAAWGQSPLEAYQLAFGADPLSAFGGIVGFSKTVDETAAAEISKQFFECVIAPDYTPGALDIFKKKQNLRLLRQNTLFSLPYELDIKKISGGFLIQQKDLMAAAVADPKNGTPAEARKVVGKRQPTPEELYSLEFAWQICKHVKSNAIVLARGALTQGVGAGQMSRIDSLRASLVKMSDIRQEVAVGAGSGSIKTQISKLPLVMASDAFFPFRDCVDHAAKAGVSAIIQPGGSIRDQESIDAANEHNIAMVFTGTRHFKH